MVVGDKNRLDWKEQSMSESKVVTHTDDMEPIAHALVATGKGILAADESTPTITKRFQTVDLPSTEENRRAYREMLFTTEGLGDFISGVILFDETLRQKAN